MKTITSGKSVLSCAIAAAMGLGSSAASADTILKFKIEDVGSTINPGGGRVFDPALDGKDGGFKFDPDNPINPITYTGVTLWTGDVGDGEVLWEGIANPTGSFSSGFTFGGPPFIPFTFGNNAIGEINITNAAGDAELTVTSLDFGGNFAADPGAIPPDPGADFLLPPDNPPGIAVTWLVNNFDGTYKASFQWEHTITSAEDPSGAFIGFNAHWILEGTATLQDAPPTIELLGADPAEAAQGVPYNDAGANCLDTVDGPINGSLVTTTDPLTDLDNPQADFQMVYNCQDSATNDANEVRRNVTVTAGPDITPPDITLDACTTEQGIDCSQDGSANTNTVNVLLNADYVDGGGSCEDTRDGVIPLTAPGADPNFTSSPFPADVNTGTATNGTPAEIPFTCRDASANETVVTRFVNVVADTDAPVINLNDQPQNVTLSVGSTPPDLAAGITCTDTNPVDNPGGAGEPQDITANLDFVPLNVDTSQTGETDVTYNCADAVDNDAEPLVRTFTVVSGQAFEIISMTISDFDGDGLAGCFAFNDINPNTCAGANRYSSDETADDPNNSANATLPGKGTDLDDEGNPIGIRFGEFQGLTLIARGFRYLNFPFEPLTFDPPTENFVPPEGFVVLAGDEGLIRLDSFPWGGIWTSTRPNEFNLAPDPGTLSTSIIEIDPVVDGAETRTFKYRMNWSHLITEDEDQTGGQFTNFNARWLIEGVITTSSTVTVLNDPPVITLLKAADNDNDPTSIIKQNNGLVTATVVAEDPNGDDLSYQWSGPVTPVGGTTGPTLTFDTNGLATGTLALNVTVTDVKDEEADQLSTTGQVLLNVVAVTPDPDYGDDDNDRIPNYLDAIDGNVTPTRNLRDPSDRGAGEIVSDIGRVLLGSTAFSTGRYSFIVTEDDIGVEDRVNRADAPLGHTGGGIYDFKIANIPVGGTVRVVLPQAKALPEIAEYRKFTPANGWFTFSATAGNKLASARRVNGVCPDPDDDLAYDDDRGLVEGDDCIRLTLVDGSSMDADGTRDGMLSDPGAAANNGAAARGGGVNNGGVGGSSSGGGCSIASGHVDPARRSDWWLVAGLVALLGWVRRKTLRST